MAYGAANIHGKCKLMINHQGGIYDNGKELPQIYRERILDLNHQGLSQRAIADEMRISIGYVNKVVRHYDEHNTSLPQSRRCPPREIVIPEVAEYVEVEKLCQPSIYTSEIKHRLLLDGVSLPGNLPSDSAIRKCVREDCMMTRKKITQVQ
ncbi:paired box protein Pax-8-like [Actinia tenebrosa]|uniref:Paired box protein Pax-8-like n=1 Tax=Actinia tenebrosa TaxID=6105 RepID=A0A6P8HY98_ACTTE|nr:paired box protein Pax-8-like [Actinia tenebrosa]